MDAILKFFTSNIIIIYFSIIFIILLFILTLKKLYHYFYGNFNEANIFRRLRRLYKKYDYPFIKEIILPINKESYVYYDAIIFGDYYIYILEIKNHNNTLLIDSLDDWIVKDKKHSIKIMNPFYELELKKHILNKYIDINLYRIIEVTIYNNKTIIKGNKQNNILIKASQITSLIRHFESNTKYKKFSPNLIEEKGNYILDINVKKRKIRKKIISDLKNQRLKR